MIRSFSASALSSAALVLTLIVVGGCKPSQSQAPAAGGGAAPPPPPPVSVAAVIERDVKEWDEFSGRLEAVQHVDIRPRVSGYINSINFREGAEVSRGDILAVIDQRPYEAELKRAQAELANARSRADLASLRLKRAENLVREKFVSKDSFQERQSEQRGAQAQIRAAQAAVESARLNVEFSVIRAPIAGRTGRAEVTVGNLVDSGPPEGTLLTTIVSLDPIYAYFDGDEQIYLKYVALARSGERASSREVRNPIFMGLANETGFPHEGQMDFVDNQLDPKTGTIRARAVFSNKERLFTPGLFARLKLVGSGTYRAILINDRAIGTDQSQKFVLAVGQGNKIDYRPIKLGPMVDGLRVVKEGLKAGELIVVANVLARVRPGMVIAPQKVPMEGGAAKAAGAAAAGSAN
jgi:RND family efflux transporter MFP subunit